MGLGESDLPVLRSGITVMDQPGIHTRRVGVIAPPQRRLQRRGHQRAVFALDT
jgi:hypothetical protein